MILPIITVEMLLKNSLPDLSDTYIGKYCFCMLKKYDFISSTGEAEAGQ